MTPDFWIPGSACPSKPPPTHGCRCCGAIFSIDEEAAWIRHVDKCFNRNEAEILMQSPRNYNPGVFGPESGDAELTNWVKRHKDAILRDEIKM